MNFLKNVGESVAAALSPLGKCWPVYPLIPAGVLIAPCVSGCLQLSAEILQRNGNTLETSKAWWPQVNLCQALYHRPLKVGFYDRFLSLPPSAGE